MDKRSFFPHYIIGMIYLVLCLLIGEEHPFSRVEMYDSFPKESEAFYLSNIKGNPIQLQKYFHYSSGNLAHNYYTIENRLSHTVPAQKIKRETAKLLYLQLKQYQFIPLDQDTIQLRRMTFSYSDKRLLQISEVLYETSGQNP